MFGIVNICEEKRKTSYIHVETCNKEDQIVLSEKKRTNQCRSTVPVHVTFMYLYGRRNRF